ncbi:MAG: NAD(P)H-quinone oxidoreductase subunit 3 [Planctomycetota bacterium]|jgi:NADH-quinone oxidoreductase subunit A
MLNTVDPLLIFLSVAIATGAGMIILSQVIGPRKNTAVKLMPYESGMDPVGDARQRFDVRYYLIAIAFLLFDVELLYLYPWAVTHWRLGSAAAAATDSGPAISADGAVQISQTFASIGLPVVFRGLVFAEIFVFVGVLLAAYAYAWKKGVFQWR